jgi:hypothetical protein
MNSAAVELGFRMTRHIWSNRLRGRKRFPIVTMLEPLETCNLTCKGCGRIVEYRERIVQKKMPRWRSVCRVVKEGRTHRRSLIAGASHSSTRRSTIVMASSRWANSLFLCTNGLLMDACSASNPTGISLGVHLDGMAGHDHWWSAKAPGEAMRSNPPKRAGCATTSSKAAIDHLTAEHRHWA